MTKTIAGIQALIAGKISDLKIGDFKAFGQVADHAEGDFTKYPAACVFSKGGSGRVLDTHRNERTFTFTIALYQEQSLAGKDKATASQVMTAAADAVIAAFDADRDLGGEVEIVRVVSFADDFTVKAGTFNFCTVDVEAVVVVQNY